MDRQLHSLALKDERDVVTARQRARSIGAALGFDHQDQIRIATAVSEITRNAFRYGRDGAVSFRVDSKLRMFRISVIDHGNGIPHLDVVLGGSYKSTTGMGMGILGTRRLMDDFSIDSTPLGTAVEFAKSLPAHSRALDETGLGRVAAEVARQHPASPIDELQTQNRELLRMLTELREREEELTQINIELRDTNRGVVALHAELDERADYLRRASELKSSFLSNTSHEFRTPLNSMLALTRMLLERMDGELTNEQDQQVRFIQQSARELAQMVDDLLDLAKVEAGRLEVRPKEFTIPDLFGALRGMLRPLVAETSLTLVFDAPDSLGPVYTDEQKVSQILRNFISNAIKFTQQGEIRTSARRVGEFIEFEVVDSGVGIAEHDQQIIFQEFSQVESSMQGKVKGTGLGLPLSRKLAELLGGTVQVESTIDVGSTFRFTVPATYAAVSLSSAVKLAELDTDRKVILIVEDNQESARMYCRYLSTAHFQPHAVSTVAEAERFLDQIRPSAVILDLLLANDTTWELLKKVKARKDPIPVLVLSAIDDPSRVFEAGADCYLVKPFAPDQMIAEIRRLTTVERRSRILLIDDSEVARYLLRSEIPEAIYEVCEARDGVEGLRMAQELKPDVIFLDFYMPDLNGAEVLRHLKNTEGLSNTQVVLHSTKTLSDKETAYFHQNSVTIFPKQRMTLPDSGSAIRKLVEQLTQKPSAEVQ